MTKYTFTFERQYENTFKNILSRLEPEEYTVLQPIKPVDEADPKYSDRETIMEMESEAALTFRMGMKGLKIRRERTEEELALEREREEKNTIKIVVKVPENPPE